SRTKLGAPGLFCTSQQLRIFKFGPDRGVGPLVPRRFYEANRKSMLARFLDQADEPGDHILDKCHVAATFTCRALSVAKIVLHVDDNQHAVFRVDSLFKAKSQSSSPIRRVFL